MKRRWEDVALMALLAVGVLAGGASAAGILFLFFRAVAGVFAR